MPPYLDYDADYQVGDTVRILWNGTEEYIVDIVAYLGTNYRGDHFLVSSFRFLDGAMVTDRQILGYAW